MTEPRVSVVIPTFNRAGMVRETIDSVLAQTVPCEVIVCDHGSTDDTPSVIRSYGERVRYVRREEDGGPIFCWLDGVLHAKGEFIHINYDDDWIDPRFVERTLELMTDDCGFVMTDAAVHQEDGTTVRMFNRAFKAGLSSAKQAEDFLLLSPRAVSPGCALFRREDVLDGLLVGRIPFSRTTYHGAGPDLLIFLVAVQRHRKFGYVDEALAHFRAHEGSITTDALADASRSASLSSAYRAVKQYHLVLKWAERTRLPSVLMGLAHARLAARRKLRSLFRRRRR